MKRCVLCGNKTFSSVSYHQRRARLDPLRREASCPARQVGKCLSCGLVQVVPMPSAKDITSLYRYPDDMAHFAPYIAQIPVHRAYFQKKIADIGRRKLGKWLDIGCFLGILLEEANQQGFHAVGIDISADAVRYCKKKKLVVYEGSITSVGQKLRLHSFDVISAFEILEHEQNPLGMMRRVYSLLKNGGIAVLTTPNYENFWRKIMGKWWVGYRHPEHVTFWDRESLSLLMKKAGFQHIEVGEDSPRPFPLSFAFTRSADYFPWFGWLFRPIGKLLDHLHIINPVNPWDDLLVYGKK